MPRLKSVVIFRNKGCQLWFQSLCVYWREIKNLNNLDGEMRLNHLHDWSDQWLMKFNTSKTVAILFSNSRNIQRPKLICNGENILLSDSHRHLGVHLSIDCKWSTYVQAIVKSASTRISMLKQFERWGSKSAHAQIFLKLYTHVTTGLTKCKMKLLNHIYRVE